MTGATLRTIPDAQAGRAVKLADAALASNTRTAYHAALARLHERTAGQQVTDESLAAHVLDLHGDGMAPASISLVPAAVGYYARAHGLDNPAGPQTKAAMTRIRRAGRARGKGQARGITWSQADAAVALAARSGQDPAGLRDAAILAVMSDALLRVSETAALNVEDVTFHRDGPSIDQEGGRVRIRSSKTDQEGQGETLFLGPSTVRRVRAWLAAADDPRDGPLFRRIRRGGTVQADRITPRAVETIIKRRAAAAGIEGSVSGHSLRVGAAQSLAAAGAGVVEMQNAGRWKSPDMPGRYAREQLAARGAVARLRYGK